MADQITEKKLAECYQPLFDLMAKEHGVTLTISEMDEIISAASQVSENINTLYQCTCDVEGCDSVSSNGGGCWRNTGYWSVCQIHSAKWRAGESQPEMKKEAIKREASRLPNGYLPAT